MVVNLDLGWITAVFLVALRVGTLLIMSPLFSTLSAPVTVRVLLTIGLSAVLAGTPGVAAGIVAPPTLGAALLAAAGEVLGGATMAFGVFAAFGACSVAGKILDVQAGFAMGGVYDPVTSATDTPASSQ